ncbi:MAG TPA: FtsX-like permease family protein [Caulobacterales bacterium]|nr:FtsX-like permease family protein [Caulobacterales bacterium]
MNEGTLVRKNLFRKGLRTTLLIFSIFIAFLIFGTLGSFDYAFNYAPNPNGANRLLTINKINFTQPLPFAYLNRIRGVEGVQAATMMNWFGGYYQEGKNQVQTMSVEPESFRSVYGNDFILTPAQWEAFARDRTGIIIGEDTAKRYGFRVGQRIPLHSDIYTNRSNGQQVWDFNVVGIFHAAKAEQPASGAYFNYEYFRESATFGNDNIGMVAMRTASVDQNDAVASRIDRMFANSAAETKTQDELAFGRSFLAQIGDIAFIITLVVSAAFASILMVVGNTMVMSIRERTAEIGVLKTLGFSSGRVMRMVLAESLALSLTGALLGLGVAAIILLGLNTALKDVVGGVTMSGWVAGLGVAIAILFGLITGAAPAASAFNLKIVEALSRK